MLSLRRLGALAPCCSAMESQTTTHSAVEARHDSLFGPPERMPFAVQAMHDTVCQQLPTQTSCISSNGLGLLLLKHLHPSALQVLHRSLHEQYNESQVAAVVAGMSGAPVVLIQVYLQLCALQLLLAYTAREQSHGFHKQTICGRQIV